jgi:cell wall-associated NlpC family hydrolase
MSLRLLSPLLAFAFVAVALALPAATSSSIVPLTTVPSGYNDPRPPKGPTRKPTLGERAAVNALEVVGVPYRWGGTSPATGFDCSGLVRWAYLRVGVDLPHSSYALYGTGREVPRSRLEAGDVLVFSGLGHVGLYIGDGRMVHAPYSGKNVEVVELGRSHYSGRLVSARRVS